MTDGEAAFAFLSDAQFEIMWRRLTESERQYAKRLLPAAARRIRERLPNIATDDPDAILVSFQVVKSVLEVEDRLAGFKRFTETSGGRSEGGDLVNPERLLIFTDYHWEQLGISPRPQPSYSFPRGDY